MREIKFRAWDKTRKCWTFLTIWPNTVVLPCPHYTSIVPLTHEGHSEGFALEDIQGWQQLTGLKDKNGKEIYEGDILQLPSYYDPKRNISVFFKDGCFYAGLEEDGGHFGTAHWKNYEIIGNIYENPELLNN